ncbi:MAG: KR domain-containing protein [Gemmatimonadetes bacterium]|nr:KR domain-containing protein [Gemmatimonadota bacterium]
MRLAASVRLRPPQIPIVGNVTGTSLGDQEATDPAYWARHLLGTVRFAEGIGELLREPGRVLLEVGPGQTLSTFVRQRATADGESAPAAVIPSLRYAYDRRPDQSVLLEALGRLWIAGVTPDWAAFRGSERRRRVRLPTYPWEKQRYWVDPPASDDSVTAVREGKRPDPSDWTYVPTWTRTPAPEPSAETGPILLVVADEDVHIAHAVADRSRAAVAADATLARADAGSSRAIAVADPPRSHADASRNSAAAAASTPPGTGGVASLSEPGRARPVGHAPSPIAPNDPSLPDASQTASSADGQHSSPSSGHALPDASQTAPSVDGQRSVASSAGVHADALRTALSGDGRPVILARPGDAFARTGDGFILRPGSRDDLRALAEALKDAPPSLVVHVANDPIAFVLLAGALAHAGVQARVVAVTRGAQEVSGDEEMDPRAAAVLGATRVVQQEHPDLRSRAVDVAGAVDARRLAAELLADADEPVVALRGRHRWARGFRAARPERAAGAVREGGVYVFVGGLEGRGAALAQAIVETPGVRIAVIDPRLPAVSELDFFVRMLAADNPILATATQVKSLAAAGVEVMTDRADPLHALADGFRRVEERWGRIDGIVHELGMGELSTLAAVAEANPAAWALELERVEMRLTVLDAALAGRAPEWVLLESSLAGVLGSIGLVRTAMANALVDAWAQRAARAGLPAASVAWDRWTVSSADGEMGIAPHEVAPALRRVLALAHEPNVLVSTGDLESRIRRSGEPAVAPTAPVQRYARPEDLGTTYAPPETETESRIAEVWQELLGVDRVGIHDDFFALGGHSLLATQIISRLKEMYELELPLKVIFEAPTISKMALLVEEAILAEIDELTEEEAIALASD